MSGGMSPRISASMCVRVSSKACVACSVPSRSTSASTFMTRIGSSLSSAGVATLPGGRAVDPGPSPTRREIPLVPQDVLDAAGVHDVLQRLRDGIALEGRALGDVLHVPGRPVDLGDV